LRGDYPAAEDRYRQSLTILEELGDRAGIAASYHPHRIIAQLRGDYPAAEDRYRQSLTGAPGDLVAAAEPGNTTYQRDVSVSYERLADLARQAGQGEQAQALYRQALTIREALAAAEPGNTTYQRDVSISYERLGVLAADAEDVGEAERCFGFAVDVRRGIHQQEPQRVDLAEELGVALTLLAGVTTDSNTARREVIDVLTPFERAGTITRKGVDLLAWARR